MATVEPEEVEGHFASQKRRAVKSLVGGVVLTFRSLVASELVRFKVYGVHKCLSRASNKKCNQCLSRHLTDSVEQPCGEKQKWTWQRSQVQPLPRVTSSSQMQCVQPSCVQAHMESLHWWAVWGILRGGQRARQVCHSCTSEQLFNCSWTHPEGNNMHLPLLHQEQREDNWWRQQHYTAACGGIAVPCLLKFYHRDTRVLGKAKLVTKKFVLA